MKIETKIQSTLTTFPGLRDTEDDFLGRGEHVETQSDFILVADAGEKAVFLSGRRCWHCRRFVVGAFVPV